MSAGSAAREAGSGKREAGLRWTRRILVPVILCAASLFPLPASRAQDRVRDQRQELERLRQERADLERQMIELRSSVHDLAEEVANINARRAATERLVEALDRQLENISGEVDSATARMATAELELTGKRATLKRRLVDIYKRGPMFTAEALLSAQSFGELVARYKYLHMLALHDRALVQEVEALRSRVASERSRLVSLQDMLGQSRNDKQMEENNLRLLERERSARLATVQLSARRTEERLDRVRRTEAQLASAIAAFEAERRRAESGGTRSSASRTASSIKTSDYGQLDWPVDGPLVYTFGKAQTASNATIRWNGVGIRAPVGTTVRSVAGGKVVSVGPLGTYGMTVIVEHGGGDYSIYGSLARADVRLHETVAKGDAIGTVGVSDPELPPHLHFEIRHGGPAVDPATWLRDARE